MIAFGVPDELRELFFPPDIWERLAALGPVATPGSRADLADPEVFKSLIAGARVVVSSWSCPPLTADVLAAAPDLSLLAHTGASLRPFVTDAAFARGVRFTQAGDAMAHAVAEQALALTLALLHRVHRFDHGLRTGQDWDGLKSHTPPRRELRGCPVGVVGASRTGRAYIVLVKALGAKVTVYDPHLSDSDAAQLGVTRAALDDVMSTSRVVALHAPVLPETRGMIGERELALMPDGALLVNTARSALVPPEKLLKELNLGRIDAALDVFDTEPLPADDPLRSLPNVLLTPHEAGGTLDARHRAGEIVVSEVSRFLAGQPLEHEVTLERLEKMG